MKKLNLILLSLVIIFFTKQALSDEKIITGKAKVTDGDTIIIKGEKIRLDGIDAPEIKQLCKYKEHNWDYKLKKWVEGVGPCGQHSKRFLEITTSINDVTCLYSNRDRYKRILGTCLIANGTRTLNSLMVSTGNAVAYRKYSKKYIDEENYAKHNNHGIWGSEFDMPWDWRRKNK